MENEFTKAMSQRTDDELIKIITADRENYKIEAINAAETEIEKRNIDISINDSSNQSTDFDYGLSKQNPVLVKDISTSYSYLNALCSIREGIEYERIGPIYLKNLPKPMDKYKISILGEQLCFLFIYAYHSENIFKIPSAFMKLNTKIDTNIFENIDAESEKTEEISDDALFYFLIDMYLFKNGFILDENISWNKKKEELLSKVLNRLNFDENIELVIINEWKIFSTNETNHTKSDFVTKFYNEFHHDKISKYVPSFINERNQKIKDAYHSILETINRIQAWLDNDLLRVRLESNLLNTIGVFSTIKMCTTPFCIVSLVCDKIGRYMIEYSIDSRILDMISNNFASTLIRRIYGFTPGEMEPFVDINSLHEDCRAIFESMLERAESEKNHEIITVKRNERESISDMLSNLDLEGDIDDETRKWFNK